MQRKHNLDLNSNSVSDEEKENLKKARVAQPSDEPIRYLNLDGVDSDEESESAPGKKLRAGTKSSGPQENKSQQPFVSPTMTNEECGKQLFWAARNINFNQTNLIRLIEIAKIRGQFYGWTDENKTLIMEAVQSNNVRAIEIFVNAGLSTETQFGKTRKTALRLACEMQHVPFDAIKKLLEKKAHVDKSVKKRFTPYMSAVLHPTQSAKLVKTFLEAGANPNLHFYSEHSPFMLAVSKGNLNCVKEFLAYKTVSDPLLLEALRSFLPVLPLPEEQSIKKRRQEAMIMELLRTGVDISHDEDLLLHLSPYISQDYEKDYENLIAKFTGTLPSWPKVVTEMLGHKMLLISSLDDDQSTYKNFIPWQHPNAVREYQAHRRDVLNEKDQPLHFSITNFIEKGLKEMGCYHEVQLIDKMREERKDNFANLIDVVRIPEGSLNAGCFQIKVNERRWFQTPHGAQRSALRISMGIAKGEKEISIPSDCANCLNESAEYMKAGQDKNSLRFAKLFARQAKTENTLCLHHEYDEVKNEERKRALISFGVFSNQKQGATSVIHSSDRKQKIVGYVREDKGLELNCAVKQLFVTAEKEPVSFQHAMKNIEAMLQLDSNTETFTEDKINNINRMNESVYPAFKNVEHMINDINKNHYGYQSIRGSNVFVAYNSEDSIAVSNLTLPNQKYRSFDGIAKSVAECLKAKKEQHEPIYFILNFDLLDLSTSSNRSHYVALAYVDEVIYYMDSLNIPIKDNTAAKKIMNYLSGKLGFAEALVEESVMVQLNESKNESKDEELDDQLVELDVDEQLGNTCGGHVLMNTLAVQELRSKGKPINGQNIMEINQSLKDGIEADPRFRNMSIADIETYMQECAEGMELKPNESLFGGNNVFVATPNNQNASQQDGPVFFQSLSLDGIYIVDARKAIFERIREQRASGQDHEPIYFILNTVAPGFNQHDRDNYGHWIALSYVDNQIYYMDSLCRPLKERPVTIQLINHLSEQLGFPKLNKREEEMRPRFRP